MLPSSIRIRLALLFGMLAAAVPASAGDAPPGPLPLDSPPPGLVWPISGQTQPDWPQSSTFGPRLKASENFRYDYHLGIDLPTPLNTPLLATLTGTVRIAGSHPAYSDGVVQIDHGHQLYSNYLHIAAALVVTGQVVAPGQPVALSGIAESGFAHLHFELRAGGLTQAYAVNPWRYLPYTDSVRQTISLTGVTSVNTVWLRVTTPADELDLNQITLTVRSALTQQILDDVNLDFEARNRQFAGDPARLDNPELDQVLIQPDPFSAAASLYALTVAFRQLAGRGPVELQACALDVHQNAVCTSASAEFGARLYLPVLRRSVP